MNNQGCCYIVATPIGHLSDITMRALDILKSVAVIAAEDTRHSQTLLQHYQVKTPCISLHEHNESMRAEHLLKRLQAGEDIALISDAGTPLISDPGFRLVSRLKEAQIAVVPIPGPCALIAALSVSGISTEQFIFLGFLPSKQTSRLKALIACQEETKSMVLYESTHRIIACLADISTAFGLDRRICLAKELTKHFETVMTDTVAEVIAWFGQDIKRAKGEFVIVIEGCPQSSEIPQKAYDLFNQLLGSMSRKDAARLTADVFGVSKNQLYSFSQTPR